MREEACDNTTRLQTREASRMSFAPSRWAIVLAGGNGDRMRPFIEGWLGEARPKQYCAFVGSRSMLEHTVDRAGALVAPEQIITVIGRGHRAFLDTERRRLPGRIIEQPRDCGTAAGIFFPLSFIMERDPHAVVLVLPSDHFVYPEPAFLCHALGACLLARSHEDSLILLGAPAARPETDYGWIMPSRAGQAGLTGDAVWPLWGVDSFQEKPGHDAAVGLFARGCLWNTMMVATTVRALWSLGRQLLPDMVERFQVFREALRDVRAGRTDPSRESEALRDVYQGMGSYDFSRDILQHATQQTRVLPMKGIAWCDWGRPERIMTTVDRFKLRPAFSIRSINSLAQAQGAKVSRYWTVPDAFTARI